MSAPKALLLAAPLLALAACSGSSGAPPSADDPRDGRVTLAWSNCAMGSCIYDWKACVGPNLYVRIGGDTRRVEDSPECKAVV